MNSETPPQNLERLLERLEQAGEPGEPVSIECMLQAPDERSFGALLLVPGLLVFSPLSGIPGLPSVFAVMVSLIAIQLLIGRKHFWLPKWLLKRSASRSKYDKAIAFLHRHCRLRRPPAQATADLPYQRPGESAECRAVPGNSGHHAAAGADPVRQLHCRRRLERAGAGYDGARRRDDRCRAAVLLWSGLHGFAALVLNGPADCVAATRQHPDAGTHLRRMSVAHLLIHSGNIRLAARGCADPASQGSSACWKFAT